MTERALLEAAAKLLRRAPKATNSMYVGTDREPWGKQAQALAKQIEEAIRALGERT